MIEAFGEGTPHVTHADVLAKASKGLGLRRDVCDPGACRRRLAGHRQPVRAATEDKDRKLAGGEIRARPRL